MSIETQASPPRRQAVFDWLAQANRQVSSWAASMSWWRLFLLFIIVMSAAAILSDQLHLRHDKVKIVQGKGKDKNVDVVIGGPDGVRITRRHKSATPPAQSASGAVPSPDGEG